MMQSPVVTGSESENGVIDLYNPDMPDFMEMIFSGEAPDFAVGVKFSRDLSPEEAQQAAVWLIRAAVEAERRNREAEIREEEERREAEARTAVTALPPKRRRKVLSDLAKELPKEAE